MRHDHCDWRRLRDSRTSDHHKDALIIVLFPRKFMCFCVAAVILQRKSGNVLVSHLYALHIQRHATNKPGQFIRLVLNKNGTGNREMVYIRQIAIANQK